MSGLDSPQRPPARAGLSSHQLATFFSAKSSLWRTLDIGEVMQGAIEAAVATTGLDSGAIYLLDNNVLYLGATTPPLPDEFPDALRYADALAHPHIMAAVDTESPVVVTDLRDEPLTAAERAVVDVRDLRSILYVPLFSQDRPIGVFMVASSGVTREISPNTAAISQALAHSIALALDDAHLFDTLMDRSEGAPGGVRERLLALAAENRPDRSHALELAQDIHARIRQRLTLLEIREELLREESSRDADDPDLMSALVAERSDSELAETTEASRAFRVDEGAHLFDLGLPTAIEYLIERYGVGPAPREVHLAADAQMVDADTAILLYRSLRELLASLSLTPGGVAERISLNTDDSGRVVLTAVARGAEFDVVGDTGECPYPLRPMRDRLRRAGGRVSFQPVSGGSVATSITMPQFSAVP